MVIYVVNKCFWGSNIHTISTGCTDGSRTEGTNDTGPTCGHENSDLLSEYNSKLLVILQMVR